MLALAAGAALAARFQLGRAEAAAEWREARAAQLEDLRTVSRIRILARERLVREDR
jgi:hypothetical protein